VPGGPLDNAAWLTLPDEAGGLPKTFLVLVEAKNLRQWIYPRTQELHQLLSKAAAVQVAHPDIPVMPVLVCRRAHYLTNVMAKSLGFYVIQTYHQYVRPAVADTAAGLRLLDEVNSELKYDLTPQDEPVEPMVGHFRRQIQDRAEDSVTLWAVHAPHTRPLFERLRLETLTYSARAETVAELAQTAEDALGLEQPWKPLAGYERSDS
jgi:hypothetical protein